MHPKSTYFENVMYGHLIWFVAGCFGVSHVWVLHGGEAQDLIIESLHTTQVYSVFHWLVFKCEP